MEADLAEPAQAIGCDPPPGYAWVAWDDRLLDAHARVMYYAFRDEIDSAVFPCFSRYEGCVRLMREIAAKPGFLPAATWLLRNGDGLCGMVQGSIDRLVMMGAIQNVGVAPQHRGKGLGRCLVAKAIEGFRQVGLRRVYLEVTAENCKAVNIYRGIGFKKARTLYKAVDNG